MYKLQILQNEIYPTYLNLQVMIDYFSKVQMISRPKEPAIYIYSPLKNQMAIALRFQW